MEYEWKIALKRKVWENIFQEAFLFFHIFLGFFLEKVCLVGFFFGMVVCHGSVEEMGNLYLYRNHEIMEWDTKAKNEPKNLLSKAPIIQKLTKKWWMPFVINNLSVSEFAVFDMRWVFAHIWDRTTDIKIERITP